MDPGNHPHEGFKGGNNQYTVLEEFQIQQKLTSLALEADLNPTRRRLEGG